MLRNKNKVRRTEIIVKDFGLTIDFDIAFPDPSVKHGSVLSLFQQLKACLKAFLGGFIFPQLEAD
jgi:hypothetical protein